MEEDERATEIEPATSTLGRLHSEAEYRQAEMGLHSLNFEHTSPLITRESLKDHSMIPKDPASTPFDPSLLPGGSPRQTVSRP
jgi:hypothetical protein